MYLCEHPYADSQLLIFNFDFLILNFQFLI